MQGFKKICIGVFFSWSMFNGGSFSWSSEFPFQVCEYKEEQVRVSERVCMSVCVCVQVCSVCMSVCVSKCVMADRIWQGQVISDPEKCIRALAVNQQWAHSFLEALARAKWPCCCSCCGPPSSSHPLQFVLMLIHRSSLCNTPRRRRDTALVTAASGQMFCGCYFFYIYTVCIYI